jgi:hypothetical protein
MHSGISQPKQGNPNVSRKQRSNALMVRLFDTNFKFVGLTVLSVTFAGFLLSVGKIDGNTVRGLSFSSINRNHFKFCG